MLRYQVQSSFGLRAQESLPCLHVSNWRFLHCPKHCRSSPGTLLHGLWWQWRAFELLLPWAAFADTGQPRESLWEVSDPLCYREEGRWPPTLSLLSQVFAVSPSMHKVVIWLSNHWCSLAPTDARWYTRNVHAIAASRAFSCSLPHIVFPSSNTTANICLLGYMRLSLWLICVSA